MSKIYLVFYVSGKVLSAYGPLPFDMTECQRHADLIEIERAQTIIKAHKAGDLREEALARSITFSCEARDAAPIVGSKDERI